jgi:hypothetical protein
MGDYREIRALFSLAFEERVICARTLAVARGGLSEGHQPEFATSISAVVVADWDP